MVGGLRCTALHCVAAVAAVRLGRSRRLHSAASYPSRLGEGLFGGAVAIAPPTAALAREALAAARPALAAAARDVSAQLGDTAAPPPRRDAPPTGRGLGPGTNDLLQSATFDEVVSVLVVLEVVE